MPIYLQEALFQVLLFIAVYFFIIVIFLLNIEYSSNTYRYRFTGTTFIAKGINRNCNCDLVQFIFFIGEKPSAQKIENKKSIKVLDHTLSTVQGWY